jgi:hypothetical protein
MVGAGAPLGARTVTVTTNAEVVSLANSFTVLNTPLLTQVAPETAAQGQQNVSVNLSGSFTHWVQGTTLATFGSGITVLSLTVTSPTSATATLNIAPDALVGTRVVTVTTGVEVISLGRGVYD